VDHCRLNTSSKVTFNRFTIPIEAALLPGTGEGWRASQPGMQTMRIVFDYPQTLKRIYLIFQGGARIQNPRIRSPMVNGEDLPPQENRSTAIQLHASIHGD